jgi:hypothetical protein
VRPSALRNTQETAIAGLRDISPSALAGSKAGQIRTIHKG